MFISITGSLGSGKSTLCRLLAQNHEFTIYSTGTIHRKLARELGHDTLNFNEIMRKDTQYDQLIDEEVAKIAREKQGERIVFDSRMAWHFVENSFKVFTTIDPTVAAQRVLAQPRGPEEAYLNTEEARTKLLERAKIENIRFKELYNLDNLNHSNYDLILDTTWLSPELATKIIYEHYLHYNPGSKQVEVVISPKSLCPSKVITTETKAEGHQSTNALPEDNYRSDPLKVILHEGYNFVISGHDKLAAALEHNLPYIYTRYLTVSDLPPCFQSEAETALAAHLHSLTPKV